MEAKNLQTPQAMLPVRVGVPQLKAIMKDHVRHDWSPAAPGVGKTAAALGGVF